MQDGCSGSQRLLRLQTRVREEIQLVAELPNVKETPHGVSLRFLRLSLSLSLLLSPLVCLLPLPPIIIHRVKRVHSRSSRGILPLDAPNFAEIDDDASRDNREECSIVHSKGSIVIEVGEERNASDLKWQLD